MAQAQPEQQPSIPTTTNEPGRKKTRLVTPQKGNHYDLATRAQIVVLRHYTDMQTKEISDITGANPRQIQRFVRTAQDRGWQKGQPLRAMHVQNANEKPKGRPRKLDEDLRHPRRPIDGPRIGPKRKPGPKSKGFDARERMLDLSLDLRIQNVQSGGYNPAWTSQVNVGSGISAEK